MTSFYGYNCLSIPDPTGFRNHIARLKPRALLFFQNQIDLAREMAANPDMVVIIRHWPDGDVHKRMSPQQWIDAYQDHASGGLYLQTTNEAGLGQDVIDWTLKVMDLAIQRGTHLCLLNPATGTWDTGDYARLAPLLRKAGEHKDLFIIGLHGYAGGVVTSGIAGGNPDNAGVAPGQPGGKNLIPRSAWPMRDVLIRDRVTLFHLGRHTWLLQYCNDNAIPMPRFALTETGFDYLGDIGNWLNTLDHSGYSSINGWQTLKNQWVKWWDGYPDEDYFIQLKYAAENLFSGLEFALLFAYGNDGNWPNYRVDNSDLPAMLESYAAPVTPAPSFDYGTLSPVRIEFAPTATIDYFNIRAMPTANSSSIGQLRDGDTLLWSANGLKSSDFTWYRVVSGGIDGFVAKTGNYDVIPIVDTVPPVLQTVVIRIPGLTAAQAQELVHNVTIAIE